MPPWHLNQSKSWGLHLVSLQMEHLLVVFPFRSNNCNCAVLSRSVVSDSLPPQAPLSLGILQARILEWVAMPSSGGLPNPEIQPRSPPGALPNPEIQSRSPTMQVDSLPSEPPGKPTMLLKYTALSMSANLENSAAATGLEKVGFHHNPKEG